ncbi:MAG: hypothetical protein ACJAV2_001389, partial [Myxococcota bacterium]
MRNGTKGRKSAVFHSAPACATGAVLHHAPDLTPFAEGHVDNGKVVGGERDGHTADSPLRCRAAGPHPTVGQRLGGSRQRGTHVLRLGID